MRRIGLLGGMSWESTAQYYRVVNEEVSRRLGGLHSADLVMVSVDFSEIETLQADGRWDEAGERLAREARRLERAGAELVLICTNTMHKVAEQVQAVIDVPLLHLADATATAVLADGVRTVALLGTAFTMEQDFYRGRLEEHGLSVLIPDGPGRAEVHRIIYEELCRGVIREPSRTAVDEIIAGLVDEGADGVILGCTELELLMDPDRAQRQEVPLYPTARLHALAAVDRALA